MASPNLSDREISELQSELHELRKLKQGAKTRSQAKSKIQIFLMKLWAGPALSKSLEDWMHAKEADDTGKTISATANLIAAVFRRFMRVGFILILLAVIPMALIVWQNIIMERQNQSLINQIKAERTASSNQQVTEYLRLLLSSDEKEAIAAQGFLVSDLVNRDLAIERLAALLKSGNSNVQCPALSALTLIIGASPELTFKDVIAQPGDSRAYLSDVQCGEIDFTGVDFGPITFSDIGFPVSSFKFSDLSEAEFRDSNLRHSDLSEAHLCKDKGSCVSFLEGTDLSYSSLTLRNQNKGVFQDGVVLTGAQMKFDYDMIDDAARSADSGPAKQIKSSKLIVPKIPKGNIIASGVCYETGFSQCYLLHKARDLGRLSDEQFSRRPGSCPSKLNGPIVLSSISSCEKLGLQRSW